MAVPASDSGSTDRASPVTTGRLLREMADLAHLCEFPDPAYQTVQFSSYDRMSSVPGGPGWFANNDGFGNETIPNFEAVLKAPDENGIGEYLICDVDGPGVIVRTWTAGCAGELRVYLDGAETPLHAGPAAEFLPCPYRVLAADAGIEPAFLEGVFQQSCAGYCPIPFAGRCRMIWVGDIAQVHFYHVQIRRYEPGTPVTTFKPEDLKTCEAELAHVARVLRRPDASYPLASSKAARDISLTVGARAQAEALHLEGPQALERLTLRVEAPDADRALRETLLHVVCDEYPWGQVQAPIGDFFGAAPGVNPYESLPFSVSPDGTMTCRYVMPFKSSLRILIENRGDQAVTIRGSAIPMDYAWRDDTSMHFRARWRVNHGVLGSPDSVQDMPFLIAAGTGRYVGTAVMLLNPSDVPTPHGSWWGEGDEKVFVDDDAFPSTFGTGSEDYFNYAWSLPDIFGYAYCGQPRNDGPGNRGFVTNQRWHVIDDLPFRFRLAFYMELHPHDRVPELSHARIAYHYARPGMVDDHVAISDEDVRPLELPPTWRPVAKFAMHDAVFHDAEALARPGARAKIEPGRLWVGGQLLVWQPATAGEELALRVPVPEHGRYRMHLGLALNDRSGRIAARLDGNAMSFDGDRNVIDLYVPHRLLARQYKLEAAELTKGEHVLAVVFDGAHSDIVEPTVGIDYVAVQPE